MSHTVFLGRLLILPLLLLLVKSVDTSIDVSVRGAPEDMLRSKPMYMAVVPRLVRPGQQVNVYMTLFRLTGRSVRVTLTVQRGQVEQAGATSVFTQPGSKLLQMRMLDGAEPGNYTLRLEGTSGDGSPGILFVNETRLDYHRKRVSCFIQTERAFYKMGEIVRFRVIAITQNQLPVKSGSITIYVKDGKGRIVQRFLAKQLFNGVYESSIRTTHPMSYGWWIIEIHGWGYVYKQRFQIKARFPDMFYVNISMPAYVKEGEYALAGVVSANMTNGMIMEGNATVYLEVQPPGGQKVAVMKEIYPRFKGQVAFLFPLAQVAKFTEKLVGTQLYVRATVLDHFYQVDQSWTQKAVIYDNGVHLAFLGGRVRVFRPNVPFTVNVAVYESDGSRLARRYRRVVTMETVTDMADGPSRVSKPYITLVPDSSIATLSITPPTSATRITVRAYFSDRKDSLVEMVASRHYTRSQRYITVTTSTAHAEVNRYMVFTVKMSVLMPELHYMIVAKGSILLASTTDMTSRQKTFSVALSRDMVPEAHLLVYCVTRDGEVLADSLSFHVDGMSANNLPVRVNKGKDFSGKTVEITAKTYPGTFIAFSAMDYDIYRRGGNRDQDGNIFLTRNAVEEDLASYDPLGNLSFSHTWFLDESRQDRVFLNAPSFGIDANQTFSFNGISVLTDAYLTRIPGSLVCNSTLGQEPCFSSGCYQAVQRCDGVLQCADGADELGCRDPQVAPTTRPNEFNGIQWMWNYFESASWAWGSFYTKPQGNIEFQVKFPVRSATWLVGAFGLNYEHGLVFTHNPTRVDTTKPFFAIMDVPKRANMGEQIGVRVCLFNYWDRVIEALVTLPKSSNYDFVHVEEFGKTSSYQPTTTRSTIQTMVYLLPGTQRFIFFPVLPLVLGSVKIKIIAESSINRQVLTKSISVKMNGITNVYNTPYLINLVSQGSAIIPNLVIPVEERFYDPEERRLLYVPGSAKASVSLVGDVMGPGILRPYLTQQKITEYFEGDGQSYVFNFAVNLYWLQFLRTTNQLNKGSRDAALLGMITALKSIVPYIKDSGGMANRRSKVNPSVWLTAFALESLSGGIDPEWEDTLFIDVDVLNRLALFTVQHQNFTTGAFHWTTQPPLLEPYNVLFDGDGVPMNVSLTAYVAIALAKSVSVLTGDAKSAAEDAKDRAAEYVAAHLDDVTDPFQLCLVTYALYVTDNRAKGNAFHRMRAANRTNDYVYWSSVPIPGDPVEIINTVPFQNPRPLPRIPDVKAIQGTAYALLVYLLNNKFEESEPIMIWLQRQRFTEGAFGGPQATIVALQALKEYGERITNRDLYRMTVTLEATGDPSWKRRVELERNSLLNFAKFPVSKNKVYGSVRATAQGTGLAILQMRTEVNVEYASQMRSQMRPADQRTIDLDLDKILFYGRNASHILYRVCVRWARPDLGPRSGNIVLEIDLPSGFTVMKSVFMKYLRNAPKYMNRPRVPYGKVIAYYDHIGTTRECIEFRADRWYPVANSSIQHRIAVYDAFNPAFQNVTLYTAYTLFHLHICQVCGSFQCPYCPYYNHSPPLVAHTTSPPLTLILALLAFTLQYFPFFIT